MKNYSAVLGGLLVIFLFHSCSNKQELRSVEEAFSVKFETDFFMPISKDSVLIDIHGNEYYDELPMLDRDQYLNNNLFLVGTNGLDVSVVDTTGRLIQNITRRGYGPGEIPIGNNAAIWQSSDGGIYVLNGGNTYTLFVFDRNANFRYSLRLFSALSDTFRPPISSFHFSEKNEDGIFHLTISSGSTLYSDFTKAYYRNTATIAQFEINEYQQKIISAKKFVPYKDLEEIKESLKEGKTYWFNPNPLFRKIGNKFYYALSFSDHIYVLDEKLQIKKEIRPKVLSEVNKGKNGSDFLLETPRQFYDRSYYQFKNYLGNLYLSNLQVIDELLIVQFQKPLLEKEFLPKFPTRAQFNRGEMDGLSQDRDQYWLIYNLENDKEELIKLPKGYGDGIFLDRKRMLVKKYFDDVEGFYLMKYTLPEAIGQ